MSAEKFACVSLQGGHKFPQFEPGVTFLSNVVNSNDFVGSSGGKRRNKVGPQSVD